MYRAVIDSVPSTHTVTGPHPHYEVMVPFSERDDGEVSVGLQVVLIPFERSGFEMHEFQFRFSVEDRDAGRAEIIYGREAAKPLLPDGVRHLVMPTVCEAIASLLESVQPELIYRVTYEAEPDSKMLCKHQMVTDTLLRLGMVILESGTDQFGREFWLMGRKEGR